MESAAKAVQDFLVDLSSFGFELEGEKVEGNLKIRDFEALNWDGSLPRLW